METKVDPQGRKVFTQPKLEIVDDDGKIKRKSSKFKRVEWAQRVGKSPDVLGIDWGPKYLITSDGKKINNYEAGISELDLRKYFREVGKELFTEKKVVVLESLNHPNSKILNNVFSAVEDGKVLFAHTWFPSTQTCNSCLYRGFPLQGSTRSWTCTRCKAKLDRDINAAQNLQLLGSLYESQGKTDKHIPISFWYPPSTEARKKFDRKLCKKRKKERKRKANSRVRSNPSYQRF